MSDGLRQAAHIDRPGALIFVELGGNDLLSGTSAVEFHDQLDKLLRTICTNGNEVVIFETPLIPFRNSIGIDQRRLAKKYGAKLLPKRFLTSVFEQNGTTLDGLHLSQLGHDTLADEIQNIMRTRSM
jgi:acyl-CoA thioesterase I